MVFIQENVWPFCQEAKKSGRNNEVTYSLRSCPLPLFFSLSSQRSKEAKKVTPDLRLGDVLPGLPATSSVTLALIVPKVLFASVLKIASKYGTHFLIG